MIHQIFPHKIYHANINKDKSFHTQILDEAKRTMDPDVPFADGANVNYKGYNSVQKRFWSDSPTYGKEFKNPAFKEVFDFINKSADKFIEHLQIDTTHQQIKMTNAFLNFGNSTGSGLHDHEGALFSYTYYFRLEGTLPSLWFLSPIYNGPKGLFPWNGLQYTDEWRHEYEVQPIVGDLFLFPAYMLHGTNDIKEDYNRWLFNGDFFIFSDNIPNFPPLID